MGWGEWQRLNAMWNTRSCSQCFSFDPYWPTSCKLAMWMAVSPWEDHSGWTALKCLYRQNGRELDTYNIIGCWNGSPSFSGSACYQHTCERRDTSINNANLEWMIYETLNRRRWKHLLSVSTDDSFLPKWKTYSRFIDSVPWASTLSLKCHSVLEWILHPGFWSGWGYIRQEMCL